MPFGLHEGLVFNYSNFHLSDPKTPHLDTKKVEIGIIIDQPPVKPTGIVIDILLIVEKPANFADSNLESKNLTGGGNRGMKIRCICKQKALES